MPEAAVALASSTNRRDLLGRLRPLAARWWFFGAVVGIAMSGYAAYLANGLLRVARIWDRGIPSTGELAYEGDVTTHNLIFKDYHLNFTFQHDGREQKVETEFVRFFTGPDQGDPVELILNRTWRPALSVTGAAGWPLPAEAGNVLRPATELKLSLRLPPTARSAAALDELERTMLRDPPYGAAVSLKHASPADGWNAPPQAPWLAKAIDQASRKHFDQPPAFMGEGGTIPFMAMLGERYPAAQFLITGVLGPGSNAHGPNEFLHLPMGKRLTCCVAEVLAAAG